MKWLIAFPLELVRAGALVLAFASLVAGLAAWGGFQHPTLDALTHFAPVGLAASAFAGLIWLASTGPHALRSSGPVALLGAFVWLALMAPELADAALHKTSPKADETLKIVQFNLWTADDHTAEKLAWLRAQDPDIIVLHEVASRAEPLLKALAKSHPYASGCEDRQQPCSAMILSKTRPVKSARIAAEGAASGWASYRTRAGTFTVAGVHLTWPTQSELQHRQLAKVKAGLNDLPKDSLILAGDFNLTPWSFTLRDFDRDSGLTRRTLAAFSWPAASYERFKLNLPFPILPIDHVYAGEAWRTVEVRRGPSLGSDHRPILVVLTRDAAGSGK